MKSTTSHEDQFNPAEEEAWADLERRQGGAQITDAEQAAWISGIDAGREIERNNAAVAAQAQPDDINKRLFEAAIRDLAAISESLGLDPDEGGAEPIIDAINEMRRERDQWVDAGYATASQAKQPVSGADGLQELADTVVIANATGNPNLHHDAVAALVAGVRERRQPQPSGNAASDGAMERALTELVDKIAPGLDTGNLVADATTASKALDRVQPSGNAGEIRMCGNAECGWMGHTDRMLGSIGPLCPECGETTEPSGNVLPTDEQIKTMASAQGMSDSRPLGQQWDSMFNLVRAALAAQASGQEVDIDAAFEAVRQQLCKLPKYSFIHSAGAVRSIQDSPGAWIPFDQAHALFDPVAVDAARAAAKGEA